MARTGLLRVNMGESRLDGVLLARQGEDEPLGKATSFLANLDLGDKDRITVEGQNGTLGDVSVIFITNAQLAPPAVAAAKLAARRAAPKAAKKRSPGQKASKARAAGKGAAKKRPTAAKKGNP